MNPKIQMIECGAKLYPEIHKTKAPFTRNHFMYPHEMPNFANKYSNADVYQTVMTYIDPIWRPGRNNKMVIDTRNSLKEGDFYLDFDSPSLETEKEHEQMKKDIEVSVRYLTLIFRIPEKYIQIYYSGRKGYHLIVSHQVIGIPAHEKLNQIYEDIAKKIKGYTSNGTLDTGIYDDRRLFRIANSYHREGEAFKIPLTVEELRKLKIKEVRELAKNQRFIQFPQDPFESKAKAVCQDIINEWNKKEAMQKEFTGRLVESTVLPPCIERMHNREFVETVDRRNDSGSALASYYVQRKHSIEEVESIMKDWNKKNCVPNLPDEDIKVITDSAFYGKYQYGCTSFKELSGICDKGNCPLFNKDLQKKKAGADDDSKQQ